MFPLFQAKALLVGRLLLNKRRPHWGALWQQAHWESASPCGDGVEALLGLHSIAQGGVKKEGQRKERPEGMQTSATLESLPADLRCHVLACRTQCDSYSLS